MRQHPEVADWHAHIEDLIRTGDYPVLTEALDTEEPTFEAAPQIARLLGYGWTLDRLEAALRRAQTDARPNASGKPISPRDALRLASLTCLPPDEFDLWSETVGHNLWALTGEERSRIDLWRAYGLGRLGPLCAAARLTPDEARRMHADGTLDEESLRALAALTGGR
jgi:hypothetical protein